MKALTLTAATLVGLLGSSVALSQATHDTRDPARGTAPAAQADPHAAADAAHAGEAVNHPVLPEHAPWAGVVVIVILVGLFLPAAVIGPIVRALAPEEEPETHSHDEPPGASGHHGHAGTHDAHGHHH